jgi:hypothetical protein
MIFFVALSDFEAGRGWFKHDYRQTVPPAARLE